MCKVAREFAIFVLKKLAVANLTVNYQRGTRSGGRGLFEVVVLMGACVYRNLGIEDVAREWREISSFFCWRFFLSLLSLVENIAIFD